MLTIELICASCGDQLTVVATMEALEKMRVEPCSSCLDSEYEMGRDEGYSEGYDEGYNEGQADCE